MNQVNRIKQLIERIDTKNFLINEQDVGFWGGVGNLFTTVGNLLGMGADAVGTLTEKLKELTGSGIPWLVNKLDGTAVIKRNPSVGDIYKVTEKTSTAIQILSESTTVTDSVVYNALVLVTNFIDGYKSGTVTPGGDMTKEEFTLVRAMEQFTIGFAVMLNDSSYDENKWFERIVSDQALVYSNSASAFISAGFKSSDYTMTDEGRYGLRVLSEFFKSGDNHNATTPQWIPLVPGKENFDRLDDLEGWEEGITNLYNALSLININVDGESKTEISEFEIKLSGILPCYKTAKFTFVKMNNSEVVNGAAKVDGRWTHILFFKDDKLTLNVYHDGTGNPPVVTTTKIQCYSGDKNDGSMIDNVVGVNESFITEQIRRGNYIFYGKVRFEFDSDSYEKMRDIYLTDSGKSTEPAPEQSQQQGSEDNTTTTTTSAPESSQSDSNKEEVPAGSGTPNTDKLIKLLIEKGVQEIVANNPKHRASMGSVSVGALINKVVTQEEYTKNEESMYAAKFIESIEKGYTKFNTSGKTNHEEKAKKEEKVIATTSNISNPTPLELNKIEEIGDDARAKTSNELSFDKNRIKTVRITSDEKTVVYIAKEDITDIVSDIEGQLERVFGGDWKLDSAKNKFMSSNKVFIFSKKEE